MQGDREPGAEGPGGARKAEGCLRRARRDGIEAGATLRPDEPGKLLTLDSLEEYR